MKKKIISIVMLILLICSMNTIVRAAGEEITFTSSKEELKSGDTFIVTIHAKSTDGLNLISANFEYDKTMLELVERGDMPAGFSDWSGSDKDEIVVMASSSPKTEADITLTFKVKNGVADNSTAKIKFTNVGMDTFAETDHKFILDDSTIELKINTKIQEDPEPEDPTPDKPSQEDPTPDKPSQEDPTPDKPSKEDPTPDKPSEKEPPKKTDSTTTNGTIPQTGEGIFNINSIILLVVLVVIATGSFIAYRRYKDVY